MKIVIDTNTTNKGGELMLYAVLQELERRRPGAEVWFPLKGLPQGTGYIGTKMNFRQRRISLLGKTFAKLKGPAILRRVFKVPFSYDTNKHAMKDMDLMLDAGGFQFSDQWGNSNIKISLLHNYLYRLKKQGTKIIYLPQAFGPFKTANGKKIVEVLNQYADCLIPREPVSYQYLLYAGMDEKKLMLYPDFTSLVNSNFPDGGGYEPLKEGIAIIPNMRMVDKGMIPLDAYIDSFIKIIRTCKDAKKQLFLLNHEGKKDLELCNMINRKLDVQLPLADRLNALEIKGLISQCYMTISSRFHGAASSLNTGVPCLATSWSHKYELLFKDFGMDGCVLDLSDMESALSRVRHFLDPVNNQRIRQQLQESIPRIQALTREMWDKVWEKAE